MRTGGLVVAAGLSSRMGAFKPMLPVGGDTLLRRGLTTLLRCGCGPVAVVTGRDRELLEASLGDLPVHCIHNADFSTSQMFDSVRLGLAWLAPRCDQVVFSPGDVCLYRPETVAALLAGEGTVRVPTCGGTEGHPVLIASEVFGPVLADSGEGGLAGALRRAAPRTEIPGEDPGSLLDADTVDDYRRLLAYAEDRGAGT